MDISDWKNMMAGKTVVSRRWFPLRPRESFIATKMCLSGSTPLHFSIFLTPQYITISAQPPFYRQIITSISHFTAFWEPPRNPGQHRAATGGDPVAPEGPAVLTGPATAESGRNRWGSGILSGQGVPTGGSDRGVPSGIHMGRMVGVLFHFFWWGGG